MGREAWSSWNESELVSLAQLGDLNAFDQLVAQYRPGALALAKQIARPIEAAEDAVQDSFLAAFKALPQLSDLEKFASWFGSIVRHRACRMAVGDRSDHVPIDELILSHSPSISEQIEQRADSGAVRCALMNLPEDVQIVMDLYYLEEWDTRQISEFLALPITTVKWRLHQGRKLMKATLSEQMEEFNGSGK